MQYSEYHWAGLTAGSHPAYKARKKYQKGIQILQLSDRLFSIQRHDKVAIINTLVSPFNWVYISN